MAFGIELIWDLLGTKVCLIFGKESASAATWMFITMVIRAALSGIRVDFLIPYGIIFALPYTIQV
jgi:hypothetical protein